MRYLALACKQAMPFAQNEAGDLVHMTRGGRSVPMSPPVPITTRAELGSGHRTDAEDVQRGFTAWPHADPPPGFTLISSAAARAVSPMRYPPAPMRQPFKRSDVVFEPHAMLEPAAGADATQVDMHRSAHPAVEPVADLFTETGGRPVAGGGAKVVSNVEQ